MASTTLASWAVLVWQELEFRGLEPRSYFRSCELDPSRLGDTGARYPASGMLKLWELCVTQTRDPGFGTATGKRWNPTTFHAIGMAWLASGTLGDGLLRLSRYGRLVAEALTIKIEDAGPVTRMTLHSSCPVHLAAVDAAITAVVRMSRMLAGDVFQPVGIQLISEQNAGSAALQAYVQCPVSYLAAANQILFSRADVARNLPTGNTVLSQANEAVALHYLSQMDKNNLTTQVERMVDELLPAGKITEETLARALHISIRNLQRKLAGEGTSFSQLYERIRKEKAAQYLGSSQLSMNEIAYLLGFSDPANFTRAFRRWYQQAPRDFRQQLYRKVS